VPTFNYGYVFPSGGSVSESYRDGRCRVLRISSVQTSARRLTRQQVEVQIEGALASLGYTLTETFQCRDGKF